MPDRTRLRRSTSGGNFQFTDPDDIFAQFFSGSGGPFSGAHSRSGRRPGGGAHDADFGRSASPDVTVLEKPLPVSLEELFNGTNKRMKITRTTINSRTGTRVQEDRILSLPIKPGLRAGSKIKFKGVGDEVDGVAQDMHFIVEDVSSPSYAFLKVVTYRKLQKPHPSLSRDGNDVKTTIDISLKEALTGWSRKVFTIDGKQVPVSSAGPTSPEYIERFPGLGMPKTKKPFERGDFVVDVRISFPKSLTERQKQLFRDEL
jgi:DnaJ homolog subfamily B member 4